MSYVGGFRKGEIDGKPFLIFTLLTQPVNPSSSSSETTSVSEGDNDLLQPQFICPILRYQAEELKQKENGYERVTFSPVSISPHFPTKGSGDPQVQYLLDSDSHEYICKLPLAPLFWCNNHEPKYEEFWCCACRSSAPGTTYYFCVTCGNKFHKECVDSPFEIKYPSCPFLSFQLTTYPPNYILQCFCCKANLMSLLSYHCPTSKLNMHPVCALKPIPFEIDHPKRHPDHPLTFFPKQAYLPCNVCGLIIESIPTYLCVPCVSDVHQFVVHQDCVDSPTVIKISRHHHRISFISSLPSGKWSCGVCRKEVDNNYGAYSCSKCHGYFVHTRCALRRDLWDGKELEGVPEEPEMVDPPFEVIADGIIRHFSHGHLLKLENNRVDIEDKFCSACVLPINLEDEFYSCMDQCDFILHEECANAPCRRQHPLHAHPLTLKVVTNGYSDDECYFTCDACERESCGFVYESDQGGGTVTLDLRCALVSEPFVYKGHEHPLFLALSPEEEEEAICQICRDETVIARKLNCIECDYIICFRCATLPYKAWYKHDKHLLTFRKEKGTIDESGWCESCERKIVYSSRGGFYSCDDCCGTTLHVDCLLGKEPYMKPGQTMINGKEVHIVRNNTMSRPFCHKCGQGRCPYGVVFIKENKTFCCLYCVCMY